MSVYRPKASRFWQYDFVLKGHRFHGSTGQETRRAAEAIERRYRLEAAEGRLGDTGGLTIDQAAGRWWIEVGETRRDASIEKRLGNLVALLGPRTRINAIETRHVSAAVQKRLAQTYQRSEAENAKRYRVAPATVNKEVVDLLRRILRRAKIVWGAQGLHEIDWKALRLNEPESPIVYFTAAQQAAWFSQCDPVTAVALRLLLTYGFRKSELFFPLSGFDPDGPRLVLQNRKRGAITVPLRAGDAAHIATRVGRAQAAGLDTVLYEAELDQDGRELRLVALTYHGLTARLRSAARRAGITVRGPIHGARHHAATVAVRRSGSLRTAGRLVGHADYRSTLRYAHALEEDVLRALGEDVSSRNSPEVPAPLGHIVEGKQRRRRS